MPSTRVRRVALHLKCIGWRSRCRIKMCVRVEFPSFLRSVRCTHDRQVIKSDFATVSFQEVEFEIPPRQRGEVTTVEGLLRTSAERLGEAQDLRMERSPEVLHDMNSICNW